MSTVRQIIREASANCPVLGVDIKTAGDVYPALVAAGLVKEGTRVIVVDGAGQRLRVLDGTSTVVKEIVCSTAAGGKFGNVSSETGHGATSTGLLRIGQIVGAGQPVGMGFLRLTPTNKIHKSNEGGHAAMTTRILTLIGEQEANKNAPMRGVYIHGTNKEAKLGTPASGGCVRVSNSDALWLAENILPKTPVYILGNPISTNPAFPSSKDCKPMKREKQLSAEKETEKGYLDQAKDYWDSLDFDIWSDDE